MAKSSVQFSHSVVSDSLRPHGLQPTRLLRPWDLPGKSTGVGCHGLLQYPLIHPGNSGWEFLLVHNKISFGCSWGSGFGDSYAACWHFTVVLTRISLVSMVWGIFSYAHLPSVYLLRGSFSVCSGCYWEKTIGCVNDKHVFCIILETGKSKNKALDNPVPNEGPCAGPFLSSYCLLTWWNGRARSLRTLDKGTNSIHKYSTLKA